MFLFEDFTYDESWAAVHYGDSFHHTTWYLEGIINDWQYMQSLPNKDDIKYFPILEKTGFNVGNGAVICPSQDYKPIQTNVNIIPIRFL